MSCQTCKFWKLIGKLEDVYQYKDSNENLPDMMFARLLPRGSNTVLNMDIVKNVSTQV